MTPSVAVIIAAYNSADTIGDAIQSALAQQEVSEVVVIDDASPDEGTIQAARLADDGTGRLQVFAFTENRGPAAARNEAIRRSRAPLIAILDADDVLLPNRFARLLQGEDWDLIADNIVFVPSLKGFSGIAGHLPDGNSARAVGFAEFVDRNISRPGRERGELGFLKPVFRRSLVDGENGAVYDPGLRLGEDFIFYATAMARGARFKLVEGCGYAAVQHANSLSGRHSTEDLAALRDASIALSQTLNDPAERAAIKRHAQSVAVKAAHRKLLDDKKAGRMVPALLALAARPRLLVGVARAVLRDKLAPPPTPLPAYRLLFDGAEFT